MGYAGIGIAGLSSLSPSELDSILSGLAWGGRGRGVSVGGSVGKSGPSVGGSVGSSSSGSGKCPAGCQYMDGGNCNTPGKFTCDDFVCKGGAWNDFECHEKNGFDCKTYFSCVFSFDASDCMYNGKDNFHCPQARLEGYYDEDGGGPPGTCPNGYTANGD